MKSIGKDVCVVVFGPVAAGKSTLVHEIALSLNKLVAGSNVRVRVLPEPTDFLRTSGQLERLAQNVPGTALSLQLSTLFARLRVSLETARDAQRDGPRVRNVFLCDGHGDLDGQLYLSEHVHAQRMDIRDVSVYLEAKETARRLQPIAAARNPDLYVYLRVTSGTCKEQCRARGRREEGALDEAYFTRMIKCCNDAAMMCKGKCLVVEGKPGASQETGRMIAQQICDTFRV